MLYLFYYTEWTTTKFTEVRNCRVTFKIVTRPIDQSDWWKFTWGIMICNAYQLSNIMYINFKYFRHVNTKRDFFQFFCILHFCHTCSLCRVELEVQFPARGSTQVLLCFFPGVVWLWHFLYSVSPDPVSSLQIYTFVVSRAFMAGAASQAGDADTSRTPGLTSGLQGSVNVHRCTLLLVPQWQCISSFVFYILLICIYHFDSDVINNMDHMRIWGT